MRELESVFESERILAAAVAPLPVEEQDESEEHPAEMCEMSDSPHVSAHAEEELQHGVARHHILRFDRHRDKENIERNVGIKEREGQQDAEYGPRSTHGKE